MGLSGLAPDKVLSAKAQAAGVPLFSEFAVNDDVVTWLGTMSPEQDLQFLRYILDEVLASPGAQASTLTDWERGDFRRATRIVTRIKQLYPELYKILVLDRNRKWVPRFKKMLSEKKPAMVVLGHFHLVGKFGRTGAARGGRNDSPKNLISRVIVSLNSIGVGSLYHGRSEAFCLKAQTCSPDRVL
jgi:hypothetical protein